MFVTLFIDFSSQNRHCEPSLDGVAIQNEEMRDKRQEIRELTTASDGNSQNHYCEERSDVAIQNCKVEAIEKPIKEVLLLQIELKKHDFDSKLIETIAKQNSHKLVFLLRYQQYAKLAIYYKQLYIGEWKPFEEVSLTLNGNNMNEVWLSFVEQIALDKEDPFRHYVPLPPIALLWGEDCFPRRCAPKMPSALLGDLLNEVKLRGSLK